MSSDWKHEIGRRDLALCVIREYKAGSCSLRQLAEDLNSLAGGMCRAPGEWIEEFQARANGIEAYYAVALDRGFHELPPDDFRRDVELSVEKLEELLRALPIPPDWTHAVREPEERST